MHSELTELIRSVPLFREAESHDHKKQTKTELQLQQQLIVSRCTNRQRARECFVIHATISAVLIYSIYF